MDAYVVAGNPVEHSQSPFIHAMFAAAAGAAMSYERLLCPLDAFAPTLQRFAAEGGRGCNVTVPFKFDAFALAPRRTPRAELAGACNTLRFDVDDDGWLGDNTDGVGLCRDIEQNAGVPIAGLRVLLVGAGGAAAGVLGPLLEAGPSTVVVTNRAVERAQALVDRHAAAASGCHRVAGSGGVAAAGSNSIAIALTAQPIDDCGTAYDVVINATSSSLAGADSPVHPCVLRPGTLAVDLMYGSAAEPFLQWAERHGARPHDGLGMLVEQAAESFLLFRGRRPATAPVLAALRARLGAASR